MNFDYYYNRQSEMYNFIRLTMVLMEDEVFESIFTENKNLTKEEFYQLITSLIRKEEANIKILKIIESRENWKRR